jgi:putative NADH-flavin reductase
MTLLLLGATGRTGKWVLKLALDQGLKVNVLVRNQKKIEEHKNLTFFQGDCSSYKDLNKAAYGSDVVISVLNISRKTDFPWSSLRTPKDYLSNVMSSLVKVLEKQKNTQLVICSAWGVAETKKDLPFWFKALIDYSNIGFAYKDHERQEKIVQNSLLKWTIIRPTGLTNTWSSNTIKVITDQESKPKLTISRKALAQFMLDCAVEKKYDYEKVVVSKS